MAMLETLPAASAPTKSRRAVLSPFPFERLAEAGRPPTFKLAGGLSSAGI